MAFTKVIFEGVVATPETLSRAIAELQAQLAGGTPGSGTVTSFGFTNANGVTGSVATPTSTPNLTITSAFTLTTTGSSGAATYSGGTLNIPQYAGTGNLTIGTSTITGGTTTRVLFDNAGVVGEYPISGTGNVAMTTSPTFVTPALGTPASGTLTNCTAFTLTTTGSSGAATYSAGTLNIPQYSGGGTPGGADTQVQFNDAGSFGGSAGMVYNKTLHNLTITGSFGAANVSATSAVSGATVSASSSVTAQGQFVGGVASTSVGSILLNNGTNANATVIQSGVAAASRTYTWPTDFGAAGSVMTDAAGNGTLSWAVPSGTGTVTHTAGALTANQLVIGNASADLKVLGTLGTTTTVLHGNASGAPTFGAVDLTADVTGVLPLPINAQTGTSYTVVSGDQGKLVTFSNSAAIAVGMPQATGAFGTGYSVLLENKGAGTVTITPTTSTIDGAATLVLQTGQGVMVVSDNTNYQVFRGTGIGAASLSNQQTAQITFTIGDGVNTLAGTEHSFAIPCVFAGTIKAYTIAADAGTCTVKTWKVAAGTAVPTSGNSISTSGVALSSGTVIRSTTLSDFTTTAIAANDILIAALTASATAKYVTFTLEILKS